MAKWTVALFGYNKPKDLGWEKRAMPGDIVGFKPFGESRHLRRERLYVIIDGPSRNQMFALCEPYWDLDSYIPYNPMTFEVWDTYRLDELAAIGQSDKWLELSGSKKAELYARYIQMEQIQSEKPSEHFRKRRFNIPMNTLKSLGVDEEKMLDKDVLYFPELSILEHTASFDKFKDRNVLLGDGLNLIKSLTLEEMKAR